MGGQPAKKRSADSQARLKALRPAKKQRKQRAYHSSDSEDDAPQGGGDFKAVNLLDSDNEDLDNAEVDDVPSGSGSDSDSDSSSAPAPSRKTPKAAPKDTKKQQQQQQPKQKARDAPESSSDDEEEEDDDDEEEDGELDAEGNKITGANRLSSRSKRNDPTAFATSLSKILSTKLSTARRADPVLARSAAAQQSARDAVDQALENKARRRLREQKRLAMEKGRVRDVLVASTATGLQAADAAGDDLAEGAGGKMETTAQIMATEKRLRKVAQRGVVKLFNAVRAAQVKAAEAERTARAQGVIGMGRREEKVAEMSKKGFLDLIASGGGGLKKGPLEEA